jgi:hypothetical protein
MATLNRSTSWLNDILRGAPRGEDHLRAVSFLLCDSGESFVMDSSIAVEMSLR